MKRALLFGFTEGFVLDVDMLSRQMLAAFQQVDGKKVTTAWNTVAAVVWHDKSFM